MLTETEDHLYQALLDRDPAYDGRAWVGVSSTGIFCRLTCPARKPKRANCRFYPDVAACLAAGFRPCKRCHPLTAAGRGDPLVADLLAALDAAPDQRWTEADIIARGHDPSTIRRAFRRHLGLTFLDLARQRRLSRGMAALAAGDPVIAAQVDAGYESGAAFRAAFAQRMGMSPAAFRTAAMIRVDLIETPLGQMVAATDSRALHLLEFADRKALPTEMRKLAALAKGDIGFGRLPPVDSLRGMLDRYFQGHDPGDTVPLALHGPPFTRQVWQALRAIPAGTTRSYSDVARAIGAPQSVRAVARANGANQIAILIPCHRVIGADGSLTGYGGGLWRKDRLLAIERKHAERIAS